MPVSANRTCALTGANGYVGSRLRHHLQQNGWRVISWTRQPDPRRDSVAFQLGQAVDTRQLQHVDALVHCAYDFGPLRWPEIQSVNVAGSQMLLAAAREAQVKSTVFISSLSAFSGCRSLYGKAKMEIEASAQAMGASVIRPGLVYGDAPGGMFGRLRHQASNARFIPNLCGGRQTQYLVHEEDLGNAVRGCLEGSVPAGTAPITVAHEQGWELKQIMLRLAEAMGKRVSFVPVPWQLLWLALKSLEAVGAPAKFRSDSLISMVYQNPAPAFDLARSLGFQCRPFEVPPSLTRA